MERLNFGASLFTRLLCWLYSVTILWSAGWLPLCNGQFGNWWSIASLGANSPELMLLSAAPNFCSRLEGLSKGQERLCTLYGDHMPSVAQGAGMAIKECQFHFRNRRWNCTTSSDSKGDRVFGPAMKIGSRESAFVNAISAAGVTYAISRSCRDGELSSCGCSTRPKPQKFKDEWNWGGCGDDVHYGFKFTMGFTDVREREKKYKQLSPDHARVMMNLHNNDAGRRVVYRAARVACKCHGVSGSCSHKTCWYQLTPFREITTLVKKRYETATKVILNKRGLLEPADSGDDTPKAGDLVYLQDSPDYCLPNKKTGTLGTKGRKCNPNSQGTDGCDIMCCGRGFNTRREVFNERCECKFQWCCYVACKTCKKTVEIHTCK